MLRHLTIRDFRNFEKLDAAIPETGLAIVGENGHGKTNFLEAISYLSVLRSMRGARDADVVRFGAPAFHVRADLDVNDTVQQVSVAFERAGKRKKVVMDGVERTRLSDALATVPSVCFSPVDVALVAGGPAERRRYLDVALALSMPSYLKALQQYRSALRQRNAELRLLHRGGARAGTSSESRIAVWEPLLVRHGAVLSATRRNWCNNNAASFSELCATIGEQSIVSLRYVSMHDVSRTRTEADGTSFTEAGIALELSAAFDAQRATELRRGITLVGPHRDELQLLLGTRDLRTFGSAGQQRTAAIALRMLELTTLRDAMGVTPLLLLDDPFAELDSRRAGRILSLLEESGVGQVVLTVPREDDIPPAFNRLPRRTMRNGALA